MCHKLKSRLFEARDRERTLFVDVGFERNVIHVTAIDDTYGIKIEMNLSGLDGKILSEKRFFSPDVARRTGGDKKTKDDKYCEHIVSSLITRALYNARIPKSVAGILFNAKEDVQNYHMKISQKNSEWVEEKISPDSKCIAS